MAPIRRALLSVSDKSGIVEFGRGLAELGIEIISTGGTARVLTEAGVPVRPVSEVTGYPEILDGRVKTLQPGIHGGILAIRSNREHLRQLAEHGIKPIDLVAVNLYPFVQTVSRPGVNLDEALENIDIGGPAMVRAAAKNFRDVIVIVNPERYGEVLAALREAGDIDPASRQELAAEAFGHTSDYDRHITEFLGGQGAAGTAGEEFPPVLDLRFHKVQDLRYGENPHQRAAFYREGRPRPGTVAGLRQVAGKELSFNNINDASAALELALEFREPVAVAVKHANPCGVGVGRDPLTAYRKAYESDPVSIFGGIVAFNRPVAAQTARELAEVFLEIVIAPAFEQRALAILRARKDLRLLETGPLQGQLSDRQRPLDGLADLDLKRVSGGLLVQTIDAVPEDPGAWRLVAGPAPDARCLADLALAWKVVKHTRSNAIVLARDGGTVGVGAGQMNRIGAAQIAIAQAGERAAGSVLASDAFFPFPDVVAAAAEAGVAAIVQPGGSIRDEESIRVAAERGLTMLFTGIRHFRH